MAGANWEQWEGHVREEMGKPIPRAMLATGRARVLVLNDVGGLKVF